MAKAKGRAPSAYNKCVGREMKGMKGSSKSMKERFAKAAKKCSR